MPVARRKERRFRFPDSFSISDYRDDELRSRYRFGRESIAFLVDLLRDDLASISNPFNPENPGISSRISMIFSPAWPKVVLEPDLPRSSFILFVA